jgi:hypothetical protein
MWVAMEKSEPTQATESSEKNLRPKNLRPILLVTVVFVSVLTLFWLLSSADSEKNTITSNELTKQKLNKKNTQTEKSDILEVASAKITEPIAEITAEVQQPVIDEEIIEKSAVPLPTLDDSDAWVQAKLPELTWRSELLNLLISEDMVRRFVVFTDNFSQGLLAYEHSPFKRPKTKFTLDEQKLVEGEAEVWQWDNKTSKRFDIYVDLLRSVDSNTLVSYYFEIKPLIDEAYSELGYDEDFTETLQEAITRVLDMELPQSSMALTRNSVMYKYQDPAIEALNESDKLLLRIGKENLLIIKSVLLEIDERLTKENIKRS